MSSITINGREFTPIPGIVYRHDYVRAANDLKKIREEKGEVEATKYERGIFRDMFLNDLFFILYFVAKNPIANHEFVVRACQEVENGPKDMTLDVWAREHFKSSIITEAETLQYHANPEKWHPQIKDGSTCFFSATTKLSKKILRNLMDIMENEAPFLNFMFPHVPEHGLWGPFWEDPKSQAPVWNVDAGIKLRRQSSAHTPSMYAAGLEEGMPTGDHYGRLVFDDITNPDVADSPLRMRDLKSKFDVAQDVGMMGGHSRVVGTFYHWDDPLVYIRDKRVINSEEPLYHVRIKPATHDGTPNGIPVLLSQKDLDKKKTQSTYFAQQLCNPVPESTRKLVSTFLKEVNPEHIPADIVKVMAVDPAGRREDGRGDNWAMAVVGIKPNTDDLGASDFYITDMFLDQIAESEGPYACAQMYLRGGMIHMLGIEKVGLSTAEVHVANALKKHGRHLSREARNLMTLHPSKRTKTVRIETAWAPLLVNGKIHISTSIPISIRDRLREELDSFPYGANDDGIDVLSYVFRDMLLDQTVRHIIMSYSPQGHIDLYGDRKFRPLIQETGGTSWMRL